MLTGDMVYARPVVAGHVALRAKPSSLSLNTVAFLEPGCPVLLLETDVPWPLTSGKPTFAKVLSPAGVGFVFLSCLALNP